MIWTKRIGVVIGLDWSICKAFPLTRGPSDANSRTRWELRSSVVLCTRKDVSIVLGVQKKDIEGVAAPSISFFDGSQARGKFHLLFDYQK